MHGVSLVAALLSSQTTRISHDRSKNLSPFCYLVCEISMRLFYFNVCASMNSQALWHNSLMMHHVLMERYLAPGRWWQPYKLVPWWQVVRIITLVVFRNLPSSLNVVTMCRSPLWKHLHCCHSFHMWTHFFVPVLDDIHISSRVKITESDFVNLCFLL